MTEFDSDDVALTTRHVMKEGWPILLVTHDADDGAWQFVNGHGDTDDTESAMVIHAHHILEVDPSVIEVSDLPPGWRAWRQSPGDEWIRAPK